MSEHSNLKIELRAPIGCQYKLTDTGQGLIYETSDLDCGTQLVEVLYSCAMALEKQIAQQRRERSALPKWSV